MVETLIKKLKAQLERMLLKKRLAKLGFDADKIFSDKNADALKRARDTKEKISSEFLKQLIEDIKSRKEISDASDKEVEEILSDTINEVDSIDDETVEISG